MLVQFWCHINCTAAIIMINNAIALLSSNINVPLGLSCRREVQLMLCHLWRRSTPITKAPNATEGFCMAVPACSLCCKAASSLSPQAPHSLRQCWSHCFSLELCKEPHCGAQAISSLPAKALKRCLTATFPKPVHTAAMCFLNCLFFLLCCFLKLCFRCVWLFHFSLIKCAVQGASLFNSRESCSSAWVNTSDLEEAVIGSKKVTEERKTLNDCHYICTYDVGWSNLTVAILDAPHCLSSGKVQMNGAKQLWVQNFA